MQHLRGTIFTFFKSATWESMAKHERRLFIAIMALHFTLSGWFITRLDFTNDESGYYGYAIRWAQGHPGRVIPYDDSKTPIVLPALIPTLLKSFWNNANDPHGYRFLQAGRWMMYVFQILGAWFMLLWLYRLWGTKKWMLPLLLYMFDPLVFSYSMIVGSDLASTAIVLAACYLAWRFSQSGGRKYWIWLSVFAGLGIIAKASLIYLLPLLFVMLTVSHALAGRYSQKGFVAASLLRWVMLLLVVLLMVNTAYYFKSTGFHFSEMPQRSEAFRHLVQRFSLERNIPVPLPFDFVSGFDFLKYNAELGGGPAYENSFIGVDILGKWFPRGPVWYYYIVTFFYKLPLLTWLLLIALFALIVRNRNRLQLLITTHIYIWLPGFFFFLVLSLTNPFQIGIRHALLIFPFMYLGISFPLVDAWGKWKKYFRWLLVLQSAAFIAYWPNLLAFTNVFLLPKKEVYRYLYDSSVSYGQTSPYLHRFLQQHPDYTVPDSIPRKGKYAVDMEALADPHNRHRLNWLYKNFEPTGQYMYTIILFEVNENELKAVQTKSGQPQ